jgi:hypothetical protein
MGRYGVGDGRIREGQTWWLSVAHDQAIERTDRVVVGSNSYYVIRINDDDDERILKRVEMERRD